MAAGEMRRLPQQTPPVLRRIYELRTGSMRRLQQIRRGRTDQLISGGEEVLLLDRVHRERRAASSSLSDFHFREPQIPPTESRRDRVGGQEEHSIYYVGPLVNASHGPTKFSDEAFEMTSLESSGPKRLKTGELPLSQAKRSAIDGLVHQFKKKGEFDSLRKKTYAQFSEDVRAGWFPRTLPCPVPTPQTDKHCSRAQKTTSYNSYNLSPTWN